jgi:isopentenyl diphosphate isomerase/L-lactate dehydrogenase-like FMN-dependent dehydrogenase
MKTGDLEGMSYESLREMARRRLPKGIFEYIDRGCEDETALDHNRRSFERIRMRPKILVDLSTISPQA